MRANRHRLQIRAPSLLDEGGCLGHMLAELAMPKGNSTASGWDSFHARCSLTLTASSILGTSPRSAAFA